MEKEEEVEKTTSKEETVDQLINKLVAYNASLQIAHWKADTMTSEHIILGNLYEAMTGLADKFTEAYMGDYGVIEFIGGELVDLSENPATKGCELVEQMCDACDDDYLCNILEEMQAELYKAKYLLKEKGE